VKVLASYSHSTRLAGLRRCSEGAAPPGRSQGHQRQ
jgi:hypothetical protein